MKRAWFILVLAMVLVLSGSAQIMACALFNCFSSVGPVGQHSCCEKPGKEKKQPTGACSHCVDSQKADRTSSDVQEISLSLSLLSLVTELPNADAPLPSLAFQLNADHAPPPTLLNLVEQSCQFNF